MGSAASTSAASSKKYVISDSDEALALCRKQLSSVFAEEFASFKGDASDGEFQEKINSILMENQSKILSTLVESPDEQTTNKPSEEHSNDTTNEADFTLTCKTVADRISSKGALTFLCCVDGSDAADLAFKTVLHMRRKRDILVMFHAYCEEKVKTTLPNFKPDAIRSRYESQLIAQIPSSQYAFQWETRGNRSVLGTLISLLKRYKLDSQKLFLPTASCPDFVVLGYAGRKGPKSGPTTLGSTADLALRSLTVPCIIAKKPAQDGPRKYIMAVNRSPESETGLDVLMRLIYPRDSLICVHVTRRHENDTDTTEEQRVKQYYETQLTRFAPLDSQFITLDVPLGENSKDVLVEYVNNLDPDYFAIAPRAKPSLSSMTEFLIKNIRTSLILCKA
mmetsp:Transcript_4051/g.6279  ORF Transcript_4051/g.6279 Transcript_4051/m.6279 type:complete len:393 (+) Transcript_4051:121-1299(+)